MRSVVERLEWQRWKATTRAAASRREILRRAGAGFGSVALAALLSDRSGSPEPPTLWHPGRTRPPRTPSDLPVHAGRPLAGRHVRPQAAARSR